MSMILKKAIKWPLQKLGYNIVSTNKYVAGEFPPDFEPDEIEDYKSVAEYTLAGPARTVSLMRAVRYIVDNRIQGDIVECGVWKGGSMMSVAKTLLRMNETERSLWLYDTFSGMCEPTERDITFYEKSVNDFSGKQSNDDFNSDWLKIGLEQVKSGMISTGYNPDKMRFVKGKVEDTIPEQIPDKIALLRLDTDWYESTRHELVHLFPRLVSGGVLLIDDYGNWAGAKEATDEYLKQNSIPLLLNRVDFSARIAVKR